MRRYYSILERCEYLRTSDAPAGHGFKGWFGVSKADATLALRDLKILTIVKAAAITMGQSILGDFGELLGIMNRDLNAAGGARDL
jgi:choline dehydrogenase